MLTLTTGRALAVIGLTDYEDGALMAVSDLILLTFTDDGLLFVDP